jgi:hypothetical protein
MLMRSLPTDEERRSLTLDDASVDITDPTGEAAIGRTFIGYSSVFGKRTAIGNPTKGGFLEEISVGAYTKTITEADQRFLLDHNPFYVVARRSAGSLDQVQDHYGLLVRANLDYNLSYVNDLAANVRNGNLTGMSVGFRVPEGKDEWSNTMLDTRSGQVEVELRTIKEIALIENSAVTFPAYTDTTASLRHSLVPALLQRRDTDAIRRAATYRPDLAQWLGFDSELGPVHIDLATQERERMRPGSDAAEAARVNSNTDSPLVAGERTSGSGAGAAVSGDGGPGLPPGEVLGHEETIHADGEVMDPSEEREGDPKKPYGDVSYADPGYQKDGKKRYPLDTKEHAKAAWSYINQAGNASAYSAEQLKSIKGRIRAACKKFGVEIDDDRGGEPAETTRTGPDGQETAGEGTEPAASTQNAPSQHELAKARLRVLRTRMAASA